MTTAIVNNYQPHVGIGKYCFNLFERLREMKKDVEMIYLESSDNPYRERKGITKVKQGLNLPFLNKTLSWYYYFPKRIPEGFDLYHLSSTFLSKVSKYRKPCVITHMDVAPVILKDYPFHMKYFFSKSMDFYKNVDKIIAISEKSKKELIEMKSIPENKVTAINLGYDERFYRPVEKEKCRKLLGLPVEKKIILNVGSEEGRKNVKTLLDSLQVLRQETGDDFTLVRIGSRNKKLEKLKKGIDVKHYSGIPEENMHLFYNSADVFVFPATYEGGIAYPPMEAMACGTPTIVTEELDVFGGGAFVMKYPFDSNALAEKIAEILTKKSLWNKMSKHALEKAKEFTLDREAKATYKIYEELIS